MQRRHFLLGSAAAAIARRTVLASPNDTVRVACVGVRSQGRAHINHYAKMPNVEIAAVCDIDESILNARLDDIEKLGKKRPTGYTDFRKLLEDKSIDAVSIATPNHHHTLQTIWACQAGKDVYVEKPCSHDMFEGRQIVAAAREIRAHRAARHAKPLRHRARSSPEDEGRPARRRLHGARAVLSNGAIPSAGRRSRRFRPESTMTFGREARQSTHSPRTASITTGTGSGITATAIWATRASTRWTSRAGAWA